MTFALSYSAAALEYIQWQKQEAKWCNIHLQSEHEGVWVPWAHILSQARRQC